MIGVLALQGAWRAHGEALTRWGGRWRPVRRATDLRDVTGLVLPGGESSTMLRMLEQSDLIQPIQRVVEQDHPLLATCAGLILAATGVDNPSQTSFAWFDIVVRRNGWGRQSHSFVDRGRPFIRAPRIVHVGPACTVLDTVRGEPALVRQGNRYGATFHPELTHDGSVYTLAFGDPQ